MLVYFKRETKDSDIFIDSSSFSPPPMLAFYSPIPHNQLHCRKTTTKTALESFYNPFPTQPWEGGIHTVMLNQ